MNDFDRRFNYHRPDEAAMVLHQLARDHARVFADFVFTLEPGRETSLAITKIEEAMFWANAAIAREGH